MKKLVLVTLGAALLLGSTSLTYAAKEGELLVWIGTNRDEAALQSILDKFTADLGIPVKVEVVDPVPDKFQQAAATGDGPDLVMFAHDRFGDWAAGGLIDPVTPSAAIKDGIQIAQNTQKQKAIFEKYTMDPALQATPEIKTK